MGLNKAKTVLRVYESAQGSTSGGFNIQSGVHAIGQTIASYDLIAAATPPLRGAGMDAIDFKPVVNYVENAIQWDNLMGSMIYFNAEYIAPANTSPTIGDTTFTNLRNAKAIFSEMYYTRPFSVPIANVTAIAPSCTLGTGLGEYDMISSEEQLITQLKTFERERLPKTWSPGSSASAAKFHNVSYDLEIVNYAQSSTWTALLSTWRNGTVYRFYCNMEAETPEFVEVTGAA